MSPIEILDQTIEARSLFMAAAGNCETPVTFASNLYEINVYRGIEQLAEAAGADLVHEKIASEEYPFQKSFHYQGVKFIQLIPKEAENG